VHRSFGWKCGFLLGSIALQWLRSIGNLEEVVVEVI
jgi:hypothetical protein